MNFLVIDFETTGLNKDSNNGYKPYPKEVAPLPRANFPVEVAAALVGPDGVVKDKVVLFIRGAQRFAPWVLENCSHLSVKECERSGVDFPDMLRALRNLAGDGDCTIVAHNIVYDWDEVIEYTARDLGLLEDPAFLHLRQMPRWCTMVNPLTKQDRSAYYWPKIGKWIGPKLGALCRKHGVAYDEASAHEAMYDVTAPAGCLIRQKNMAPPVAAP